MKAVKKEDLVRDAQEMADIVKYGNLVSEIIRYEHSEQVDNFLEYVNSLGDVVLLNDEELHTYYATLENLRRYKTMIAEIFDTVKKYE